MSVDCRPVGMGLNPDWVLWPVPAGMGDYGFETALLAGALPQ